MESSTDDNCEMTNGDCGDSIIDQENRQTDEVEPENVQNGPDQNLQQDQLNSPIKNSVKSAEGEGLAVSSPVKTRKAVSFAMADAADIIEQDADGQIPAGSTEVFICEVDDCGLLFETHFRLVLHQKKEHQPEKPKCDICSRFFKTVLQLDLHKVTFHSSDDNEFPLAEEVLNHLSNEKLRKSRKDGMVSSTVSKTQDAGVSDGTADNDAVTASKQESTTAPASDDSETLEDGLANLALQTQEANIADTDTACEGKGTTSVKTESIKTESSRRKGTRQKRRLVRSTSDVQLLKRAKTKEKGKIMNSGGFNCGGEDLVEFMAEQTAMVYSLLPALD